MTASAWSKAGGVLCGIGAGWLVLYSEYFYPRDHCFNSAALAQCLQLEYFLSQSPVWIGIFTLVVGAVLLTMMGGKSREGLTPAPM